MDLELQDRVVIVTGGARGIGAGIVRAFAREGAIAIILGRDPSESEGLVKGLADSGCRADSFHVELTDTNQVQKAIETIAEKYGRIDILVNNAGVNDGVSLRHKPEDFMASLERNLVQVFTCAHYCLSHLRLSKGCIVNIGSKTASTGQGATSGYAASKGGINALTREWAVDLAPDGIRVNCVVPAEVITPLYEQWLEKSLDPVQTLAQINRTVPLGRRTTTINEIADTVAFIASTRSSHTTGQILYVDGGYVHLDRAHTAHVSHLKSTE
ncbi:MAG: SDR family oxidoreductase [Chthoniobacterales bacterium]